MGVMRIYIFFNEITGEFDYIVWPHDEPEPIIVEAVSRPQLEEGREKKPRKGHVH